MTSTSRRAAANAMWLPLLLFTAYVVLAVGLGFVLIDADSLAGMGRWFDPVFYAYNALIALTAVMMPPAIALSYVYGMRGEKERRLQHNLGPRWAEHEEYVGRRLEQEFRFGPYAGAVCASMFVVAFGTTALLFMKPLGAWVADAGGEVYGIDITRGLNFLVLGPFMRDLGDFEAIQTQAFINLTAFQFGFLGAWVYFLTSLIRSYFTCDLSPSTFVAGTIRMVTASVVALVAGVLLPVVTGGLEDDPGKFLHVVPVIGFFFGYFPSRALLFIEQAATRLIAMRATDYTLTPLSALPGVSYAHEVRLRREGLDSIEDLSQASAIDLALRTGFCYGQLTQWIGEAWLRVHLGERDFTALRDGTGITSREELATFLRTWQGAGGPVGAEDYLAAALPEERRRKLAVIARLLLPEPPQGTIPAGQLRAVLAGGGSGPG